MGIPSDLDAFSLNGIANRCQQESEQFFRRQSFDPRYCFELFRRAFLLRSQEAWECVFRQYHRLVLSWVDRHPLIGNLDEEPEYYLNRAFEKMWQVITPQKFAEFHELKSILRYLQMCVHSVIVDYSRAREQTELLDEDSEPDRLAFSEENRDDGAVEDRIIRRLEGREVWDLVAQRLKTEQERVLVLAIFVLALKPREAIEAYPGCFHSVNEIYMLKDNLLARLRRDKELMRILLSLADLPPAKTLGNEGRKEPDESGKSQPADTENAYLYPVKKGR